MRALGTWQGRYSGTARDSTNGCTVIAACVAIKHMAQSPLSDAAIDAVIDTEAPPLIAGAGLSFSVPHVGPVQPGKQRQVQAC